LKSIAKIFSCLVIIALVTSGSYGQKQEGLKPPQITRILFILDASGSMTDKFDGRPRMDVAKEILSQLVDSLKNTSHLELALRVYGHQWDKRYNNCKDTKLEVPFKPNNHEAIKLKIKGIEPKGTTLIAHSLLQATDDFPVDKNSRNVIILITDGIEACGGDPCALSLGLQKKRIFLKPFIIGIGADENFAKEFECMGQYFEASDIKGFKRTLDKIITQTLKETTVVVNLLDIYDRPTETNVNMSFINTVTNEVAYDFVHYRNAKGKSDPVKIDAILTYDIVVNTIPIVIKKNVFFEGGKENIVNIKTPQGTLEMINLHKEYKELPALIRENNTNHTLNIQRSGTKEKYLVGTYDVEVLTLPRTYYNDLKIEQSKNTTISIDQPGILNITDQLTGFGSLYEIKNNGEHEWIYNLENENSRATLAMQPGNYKFVFRSKKSMGSEHTDVQFFTIRSGATTNLKIFNK
jgi:Ca-activated chloride channel family protein